MIHVCIASTILVCQTSLLYEQTSHFTQNQLMSCNFFFDRNISYACINATGSIVVLLCNSTLPCSHEGLQKCSTLCCDGIPLVNVCHHVDHSPHQNPYTRQHSVRAHCSISDREVTDQLTFVNSVTDSGCKLTGLDCKRIGLWVKRS